MRKRNVQNVKEQRHAPERPEHTRHRTPRRLECRKGNQRRRVITREEHPHGATSPTSTVRQTIEERDIDRP